MNEDNNNILEEQCRAYTLIFKIIELLCKNSTKISVKVLKQDIISVITKWLQVSKRNKENVLISDNSESSEQEELKVGSGGTATTTFYTSKKHSASRSDQIYYSQQDNVYNK